MLILYSLLMPLLVPFMVLRLLLRSRKNPDYRARLLQRLALNLPAAGPAAKPVVWIHAVSVGETLAIAPLVELLLTQFPEHDFVLTSTTPTGADQVRRLFADRVVNTWVPFDTRGAVDRFLDHWQPKLVLLVETEIWPQIILRSHRRGIPTALLNARLSKRSARGYARVGALSRRVVGALAVIACQGPSDARRFEVLGATTNALKVVGSVKFDVPMAALSAQRDALSAVLLPGNRRPVVLAASTHIGEDGPIISAFKQVLAANKHVLLVLAPRHPERVPEVAALLDAAGLSFQRRSGEAVIAEDTQVLLVDTLGELGALTGLADVAFVGGSLVAHGGHNPLEAAAFGVPVLTGPHRFNFAGIYGALLRCGGAREVTDGNLAQTVGELLADAQCRLAMGLAARQYLEKNKGALQKQYALIEDLLR